MKIIINKFLILEKIQKSKENIAGAYKLYKSRPKYHHVSAKKKLLFSEHTRFVQNNPYRKWFIIKFNNTPIGTIYFTFENNIGFFILHKYSKYTKKIFNGVFAKIKPLPKKLSINQDKFTINISSNNKIYQKIINDIGGRIIQKTYIF